MFRDIFKNLNRLADKWDPYFDVYEDWIGPYFAKPNLRILEIGVYKGGSIEMWRKWHNSDGCTKNGLEILAIDIDPSCKQFEEPGVEIMIGDQGSTAFWDQFKEKNTAPFDIIIDDGGHHMNQQILTLYNTWPYLKDNGIYLCEDTHTSYYPWPNAGIDSQHSFINFTKQMIDAMHENHLYNGPDGEKWTPSRSIDPLFKHWNNVRGIHYYDSIVVIEKRPLKPFIRVFS